MYARVFSTQSAPEQVEALKHRWETAVAPQLKQAEGFRGALVLGDPATGKGMAIVLWDTEAQAIGRDTSGESDRLTALVSQHFTEPPTHEILQVMVQI